jgi:hypothetical protein
MLVTYLVDAFLCLPTQLTNDSEFSVAALKISLFDL